MEPLRDVTDTAVEAWSTAFPDADLRGYAIVVRLIRAGRLMEAGLDRVTTAFGFDVRGDYEVLAALRRALPNPMRPQELADRVMISAPGVTGRLDRLERAGLVRRTPHPTDRRSTLVDITDDGIERADRAFHALIEEAVELLDGFPAARRQRLTQELRELLVILGDTA